MKPPKIIFKGRPKAEVSINLRDESGEIELVITDRCGQFGTFINCYLDLSTAQSLKKHLGWLIAEAKKQGHE